MKDTNQSRLEIEMYELSDTVLQITPDWHVPVRFYLPSSCEYSDNKRSSDNISLDFGTSSDNLSDYSNENRIKNRRISVVWAHGLDSGMENEDGEKLWNFWDYLNDNEDVCVVRYTARGHGLHNGCTATSSNQCTWHSLGLDMIHLLQYLHIHNKKSFNNDAVVIGGSSMGAATCLHAAVEFKKNTCAADSKLIGVMLVIPPTCYEERRAKADRLRKAAFRTYDPLEVRLARSLFEGHDPIRGGHNIRSDSYVNVMTGASMSDFPSKDSISNALGDIPVLVLSWDCKNDTTHPVITAHTLSKILPHAEVHIADSLQSLNTWPHIMKSFLMRIGGNSISSL